MALSTVAPVWRRVDLRLETHRIHADVGSLYEVSARQTPPLINLDNTPGRWLLGPSANDQLTQWMRANYARLSRFTRLCLLAIFAMWAAPRSVGRVVTPLAALGCLPILVASPLVMSADVLQLLCQQHEFWFFAITSANNWIIASILFNDARVAGCVVCFAINLLAVMMDANFRTIILAARTGLAWFPALLCILLVCTLRVVDIDPDRFHAVIPHNKIHFTLANWFLNINATLVIFLAKQTFRRRRVFTAAFVRDRTIPCATIHWDLVLRRMKPTERRDVDRVHTFLKIASAGNDQLVLRRPSFLPTAGETTRYPEHTADVDHGTAASASPMQTIRVITPTLAFLDLRNALVPALMPSHRLSRPKTAMLYTIGALGLLLAAFTMYLPAERARTDSVFDDTLGVLALPTRTRALVPVGALVCTTLFVACFVGSYQRDILRALRHNFDFLFTSLQFHVGCLCLADMMHWDTRCLALVAWDLWFHWILLWDALVPELRDRFRFKKIYGTPVLLGTMLGLVWIGYSLFFSAYDALDDRALVRATWGAFELSIRTSTFLVGRLTTVLTWSLRLVWKALRAHEDDLVFIRGRVEYVTPLEFFPPMNLPVATGTRQPHALCRRLRGVLGTRARVGVAGSRPSDCSSSPTEELEPINCPANGVSQGQ